MNSENERKYLVKAKDSFKTKKQMYIFSKIINKDQNYNLQDFANFKITADLVEIYTTKYWQYGRENVVHNELTPDKIYYSIKDIQENQAQFFHECEKLYVRDFPEVFPKEDFENLLNSKHCSYCNITESQILELANSHKLYKKNERGWKLEIDRKNSNFEYSKDNCVMACYWCNNAKTDEFTAEEFAEVGIAIGKIWEMRLGEI